MIAPMVRSMMYSSPENAGSVSSSLTVTTRLTVAMVSIRSPATASGRSWPTYPGLVQKLVKYSGSCSTSRSAIEVHSQI